MPRWSPNRNGVGSDGAVVSYRLARERVVASVERGARQPHEVCDAQPELRRVAHNHSRPLDEACPICAADELVVVTFAFGAGLPKAGRCVDPGGELEKLRVRGKPSTCYEVEVCRACWWNHLRASFALTGRAAAAS